MGDVRILLVEDDGAIARSVAEGLAAAGYDVTHVGTGADALGAEGHDMVLLDLGLPDMDGRDVCRELRARSRTPIIMLTASEVEPEARRAGVDAFLRKPRGVFSLTATAARLLERADVRN